MAHGFWQVSLMQVKLGGQSLSIRHSGITATTAIRFQAHALEESDFEPIFDLDTYVLYKLHSHLQSMDTCNGSSLGDHWQYSLHQMHTFLDCRAFDIPSL